MAQAEGRTKQRRAAWRDAAIGLVCAGLLIAAAVVWANNVGRVLRIPSASMLPTLDVGDMISADPVTAGEAASAIKIGDIVVNAREEFGEEVLFVRRVIALEGQRIAFRDGAPVIDGVQAQHADFGVIERDGEQVRLVRETLAGRSYLIELRASPPQGGAAREAPEYVVPDGHVVLIGDARDNSVDSRMHGPEPMASVRYRVERVLYGPARNRFWAPVE